MRHLALVAAALLAACGTKGPLVFPPGPYTPLFGYPAPPKPAEPKPADKAPADDSNKAGAAAETGAKPAAADGGGKPPGERQ